MNISNRIPLVALAFVVMLPFTSAQQNSTSLEVNFIKKALPPSSPEFQAELRERNAWRTFVSAQPRWSVTFNEASGMPHRAYGPGIPTTGGSLQERVSNFMGTELIRFGVDPSSLVPLPIQTGGKSTYVHFDQVWEGIPVITGHVLVKLDAQKRVISFSTETFAVDQVDLVPSSGAGATDVAESGIPNVTSSEVIGLKILPMPKGHEVDARLVHEVLVYANTTSRPARYLCWVDAHSGELLYRKDQVVSHDHGEGEDAGADVQVNATVYVNGPMQPQEVVGLPDLRISVNGVSMYTDVSGFLPTGVSGPVDASYELYGRWSSVFTASAAPAFSGTLNEGANTVSFDGHATIQQRTAYWGVNQIHQHANNVLPTFTGMDNPLSTNVDDPNGDCNAFYDGNSINFYSEANGCRSLATVPDVIYHEYGHGINDKFYQSQGSNFSNGGMNEGYADVWAFTLSINPILAEGYMLADPNSNIRRYDIDPKVYPIDITGEVHADGEIIAGAWWDTYVLLGNDMPLTIQLFAEAFPGLQAATFNGNEGPAFHDVLIDVLQADDDDGNITNGTPNGNAIVEAFGIHGISLLSNITFAHNELVAAPADVPIDITADVEIFFPDDQFLSGVRAYYRLNNSNIWSSVLMTNTVGSTYDAQIPGQPAGTVIAYYLALEDINQVLSSVEPIGAATVDPNLPYYILVGMQLELTEDADQNTEIGNFVEGLPSDDATTGLWEFALPIGSYGTVGDPSSVVAPNSQHTPNGEFCWVTGNSSSTSAALGENDVDGGTTTLMTPDIDLTPYAEPVISYWRWYTNNPPSGANPNADWWQVYISNNGGTSWVPVEDTKSGDRSWRRMAFRVQDYVSPTANIRLKFHASDSLRPGQNLDGGSLVEAGLDDFQVWDLDLTIGMEELVNDLELAVYPDPANDQLTISFVRGDRKDLRMEVLDMAGRTVFVPPTIASDLQRIEVDALNEGQYMLRMSWQGGNAVRRFSVVR
ncbi:MAG: T9SS type A sorting domain-containing protein [Flavobacteriales bacterium]|nr:T9SS type A sorting domain-containing protein [Flavobacteriales bacterium]